MDTGERDLARLLSGLNPTLSPERYAFEPTDNLNLEDGVFALIREDEAITSIRVCERGEWARISLGVHSALDAVGLTAAFAKALTAAGISSNVVAAVYHDHIFVQWDRRDDAMKALTGLGE